MNAITLNGINLRLSKMKIFGPTAPRKGETTAIEG